MQTVYKLLLIISPGIAAFLVGFLSNYTSDDPGNMSIGIGLLMTVVFGIPFVAIFGLITSFITRKKPNAAVLSIYAYLMPAIVTWLFAAAILFG